MKNFAIKTAPLLCVFAVSLMFAGCRNSIETTTNAAASPSPSPAAESQDNGTMTADIQTDPDFIDAGKEVELAFTLKNNGKTISDIPATAEKPLHLFVVSQDLNYLADVNLKQVSDSSYRNLHTFPQGGRYTMFLDVKTPDGKENVVTIGAAVAGKEPAKMQLKADALPAAKTVDGVKAELAGAEFAAGKDSILTINLKDVEDPRLIVVSDGAKDFVKTTGVAVNGEQVSAHVNFPHGGLYKIWAQFKSGDKTTAVPFVVQVKNGENEIDYSKIEIPKGATKVTIGKDGFEPKTVEVKAGHPLTLAFIRIDNENCGTEVVFPSLNIKKELPLGKVVTIYIPWQHPGEYNFACGMDMYKGMVLVED
jgi:plastocyanin